MRALGIAALLATLIFTVFSAHGASAQDPVLCGDGLMMIKTVTGDLDAPGGYSCIEYDQSILDQLEWQCDPTIYITVPVLSEYGVSKDPICYVLNNEELPSSPADGYGDDGVTPQDGSSVDDPSGNYGDGDVPQDGSGDQSDTASASTNDSTDVGVSDDSSTNDASPDETPAAIIPQADGSSVTVISFANTGSGDSLGGSNMEWIILAIALLIMAPAAALPFLISANESMARQESQKQSRREFDSDSVE